MRKKRFLYLSLLIILIIFSVQNSQKVQSNCFNLIPTMKMCFDFYVSAFLNVSTYYLSLFMPLIYGVSLLKSFLKKGAL